MKSNDQDLSNMTEDEIRLNKKENEAEWYNQQKKYQFEKPECNNCYQSDDEIFLCPPCEQKRMNK